MVDKIVIGKNSSIAKGLSLSEVTYLSHNDSFEICGGKLVVVFSVDKKNEKGNELLFEKLVNARPSGIVLVSSVSVLIDEKSFYTYVKMKVLQEKLLLSSNIKFTILRLSTPDWLKGSERIPNLLFKKESVENYLNNINLIDLKNNIEYIVDYSSESGKIGLIYYRIYSLLPTLLMRFIDPFMRFCTNSTYGYSIESVYKYHKR